LDLAQHLRFNCNLMEKHASLGDRLVLVFDWITNLFRDSTRP
jgi:hypothetical protein